MRRSVSVADRFVVTGRGIVRVPRALQQGRRLLVVQQPVHPDAHARLACHRGDSRQLLTTFALIVPGVDSVNAQLATFPDEHRVPITKVGDVVGGRPAPSAAARHAFSSVSLEGNQVVRGRQTAFHLQIPCEGFPEIFRPAQIDERK